MSSLDERIRASFNRQSFMKTLGARLLEVEAGKVVIAIDHRDDLCQQHGFVHAGALTTIVDSACGYAALTMMVESREVLTVEFKVNFMAPATPGTYMCTGTVIRAGKTITVCEGTVFHRQSGKEVARMQATMIAIEA